MLIPKKVKVAGHTYKVGIENERLNESGLAGDCWHGELKIGLTDELRGGKKAPPSYIEETFIHEILHCVDVQYNNNQLTEEQVVRLATGLHQVTKDLGWLK